MSALRDRLHWESVEERILAPYAAKSGASRGRAYFEEPDPLRTAFQRDRDRVLHSRAFRRLEYKTQVFVNHEGDLYRTRLTHTLEVAQIARTIARALGLNEDLTEAIALAHDLGHTPFGHAGERAMQQRMREHGGFEHNAQTLRILDVLEQPKTEYRGLNLTFETRLSVLKHGRERHPEFAEFRQPYLEAQVADVADSIAYCSHDIDDGFRARILDLRTLKDCDLWTEALESARRDDADREEKPLLRSAIRRLIHLQVDDALQESARRLAGCASLSQALAAPAPLIAFSSAFQGRRKQLQETLFVKLYRHPNVMREAHKGERIVEALFDEFLAHPDSLPLDFQTWGREIGWQRAVCDYVAGMTDRYAHAEHRRLFETY